MRHLMAPFLLLAVSCIAPAALAGGHMTEAEVTEVAGLIAYGAVTDIVCDGEPVHDDSGVVTRYIATLAISATEKGDEGLTEVTLPFAEVVTDSDLVAGCAWSPSYRAGQTGRFYLTTGEDSEHHTLVGAGAFVADSSSEEQPLPACEAEVTDVLGGCSGGGSGAPGMMWLVGFGLLALSRRRERLLFPSAVRCVSR
jgi:MYXO-CTERM domain-containing protein